MSLRRTYRLCLGMLALLIMSMQTVSIAHAAQFGDAPHEHNGMVCTMDAIAVSHVAIIPAPVVAVYVPVYVAPVYQTSYISAAYITPQGRAPPPRSPPTPS